MSSGINFSQFQVDDSGRVTVSGIGTGIDFLGAVDRIIAAKRLPVDRLETRITDSLERITALQDMDSLLNAFRTSLDGLRGKLTLQGAGDIFEAKSVFASTTRTDGTAPAAAGNLVGVSVTNAADTGSHTLEVLQIAQAHKIGSATANSNTADLGTAFGGTSQSISGAFEINGRQIVVEATDSLVDLADRINTANTGASATGVSASIVSITSNQHVLVLTADKTGEAIVLRTSHRLGTDDASDTTSDLQTALSLGSAVEGNFEINGVRVTVTATDTLDSLVAKINSGSTGATASIVTDSGSNNKLVLTTDDATKTIALTNATHQSKEVTDSAAVLTAAGVAGTAHSFVIRDEKGVSLGTINYNADNDSLDDLKVLVDGLGGVITATVVTSGVNKILQITHDNGTTITVDTDTGDLVSVLKLNKDVMSQLGLSANRGDTFKNELSITKDVLADLGIASRDAFRNGLSTSKVALADSIEKITFDGTQSDNPYEITFDNASNTMTVTLADGTGTTSDSYVLSGADETARFTVGGVGISIVIDGDNFNYGNDIVVAANTSSIVTNTGVITDSTIKITDSKGDISGITSSTLAFDVSNANSIVVSTGAFSGTFDGTSTGAKTVTLKDGSGNELTVQFTVTTVFDTAGTASITLNSLQNTISSPNGSTLTNQLTAAQSAQMKADGLLDLAAFQGSAQATKTDPLSVTGTLKIATPNAGDVSIAVASGDNLNVIRDKINANTTLQAAGVAASIVTDIDGKFHLEIRRLNLATTDTSKILTTTAADGISALNLSGSLAFAFDDGRSIKTIAVTTTDSLSAVANTINADADLQKAGVTASVVQSGATFKLQINYNTDLTVTSEDNADTALGLTHPELILERKSNSVNDLFAGATISIFQAQIGTTIRLDIEQDLSSVKTTITDFVDSYNALKEFLNEQQLTDIATGAKSGDSGPLFGNPALTSIETSLSQILGQGADGLTSGFQVLSQIGIDFVDNSAVTDAIKADTLSVDDTKLDDALLNKAEDVRRLFEFDFSSSNPQVALIGFGGQTTPKTGGYKLDITYSGGAITAATIDGVAGSVTITGTTLTATDKTKANGLKLIYNGTASVTGITLDFTAGLASELYFEVDGVVDTKTGSIQGEINALTDQNKFSETRIAEMLARLEVQRQGLIARFIAMEQSLTTINNTLVTLQQTFELLNKDRS